MAETDKYWIMDVDWNKLQWHLFMNYKHTETQVTVVQLAYICALNKWILTENYADVVLRVRLLKHASTVFAFPPTLQYFIHTILTGVWKGNRRLYVHKPWKTGLNTHKILELMTLKNECYAQRGYQFICWCNKNIRFANMSSIFFLVSLQMNVFLLCCFSNDETGAF